MVSPNAQRERRTKRRLDGAGTSRRNPTPSSSSSEEEHNPWPYGDGQPIEIARNFANPREAAKSNACLRRPVSDEWDDYDSLLYNAWLGVEIAPTRFLDPDIIRILEIRKDLEEMLFQIGFGTMASRPYDLYPSLVRQFMATVRFEYTASPTDGVLSFFSRGIRYYVPVADLCTIYGFTVLSDTHSSLSVFPKVGEFWEIFATGPWSSASALQTDIRHPTLRYFMRVLACTLLCKMEPNKVRIHELRLLYHALDAVVSITRIDPDEELTPPNLGVVFAEHLVSLKTKPFYGTRAKEERVGSLLTPIFQHLGIRLDATDVVTARASIDAAHLRNSNWIDRQLFWRFRTPQGFRRITLPNPAVTDFLEDAARLRFEPDERLVSHPPTERRDTGPRSTSRATPAVPLSPFPDLTGMETGEEGVFRRGVLDALRAIWSRVSRCSCSSRASTSASDPSAPGPSHQYRQDDGDDDEGSDD